MSIVVADGVSKMWTATAGLRRVDLSVDAGELLVVRGRSGSGKSTLLAVLAGLCRPDAGSLTVDGRPPRDDEPWRRIAFVPQVLALAVELSVRENIDDAIRGDGSDGRGRGAGGDGSAVDVDALLGELGLSEMSGRAITELSMGQQQRVSLARAVAARPTLLLADEPTCFQDDGHAHTVVDVLRRAADLGSAVVVATHDETVVAAADRVLAMSD